MTDFGWSYPAGCSSTPYDECPDDSICAFCERKLPENPQPETWGFHGFCNATCALRMAGPFDVHGTALVLEVAGTSGRHVGPGFEADVLKPLRGMLLRLEKHFSEDDRFCPHPGAWSWRIYNVVTNQCLEQRFTPRAR